MPVKRGNRKLPVTYILWIVLYLFPSIAGAALFKCTDREGNLAFSDKPCPGEAVQEQLQSDENMTDPGPSLESDYCSESISNGKDWLGSMREVAAKNLSTGHMTQAQYDAGIPELKRIEGKLNQRECTTSTGKVRRFFECLNHIGNHIARCMVLHKPYDAMYVEFPEEP